MTLSVVKEDNRFRVEWQGNSTDWLPDTASNRKTVPVHQVTCSTLPCGRLSRPPWWVVTPTTNIGTPSP